MGIEIFITISEKLTPLHPQLNFAIVKVQNGCLLY